MSKAIENLMNAQKFAMENRPKIGGFPFLAETLRLAGVTKNLWSLPSCQSIYHTKFGAVVLQLEPLVMGVHDVAVFNEAELIRVIRLDQAGKSSFQEFLAGTWKAGVVSYDVDFEQRKVSYFGVAGELYVESYAQVKVDY